MQAGGVKKDLESLTFSIKGKRGIRLNSKLGQRNDVLQSATTASAFCCTLATSVLGALRVLPSCPSLFLCSTYQSSINQLLVS